MNQFIFLDECQFKKVERDPHWITLRSCWLSLNHVVSVRVVGQDQIIRMADGSIYATTEQVFKKSSSVQLRLL